MYNNKRILALIPARGGSKGIKGKNIINLAEKPLISHTINAALNSKYIDTLVVSTDSIEIARVAEVYGARVPFMRPKELAEDTSKTIDCVVHAIRTLSEMNEDYDVLVLLQTTQPLRTSVDIDEAIELFFLNGEKSVVSISEVSDNPVLVRYLDENNNLQKLLNTSSTCRRQDMPKYYRVNGCIYINKVSEISYDTSFNDNTVPFIMNKEHSVDIDDMSDLWLAEYYMKHIKREF